jgi:hypothetical protein
MGKEIQKVNAERKRGRRIIRAACLRDNPAA